MLDQFIEECKKVEPRLQVVKEDKDHTIVKIGDNSCCISGCKFAYQAYLITHLMHSAGTFC